MKRLAIVFGSRPEVIKLWPVIAALRPWAERGQLDVRLLCTGQQRQLVDQALAFFNLRADADLDLMQRGDQPENPAFLHTRLVAGITDWLQRERPDRVLVQGDTSTAWAAALAALYCQLPLSHLEAGLRTGDLAHPFPEELHRRGIAICADQHFCPTPRALRHLQEEGIDTLGAHVVGNTAIDAARMSIGRAALPPLPPMPSPGGQRLFVTVHRRENHHRLESQVLPAIRAVVRDLPHVQAVVAVHPNPTVRRAVQRALGGIERVVLAAPLSYGETLAMLQDAALVVTDSGGLQEEATVFGAPVVVLRERTERQEGIEAGHAVLPGTSAVAIAATLHELLQDDALRAKLSHRSEVFGDGRASERVCALLLQAMGVVTASEGAA